MVQATAQRWRTTRHGGRVNWRDRAGGGRRPTRRTPLLTSDFSPARPAGQTPRRPAAHLRRAVADLSRGPRRRLVTLAWLAALNGNPLLTRLSVWTASGCWPSPAAATTGAARAGRRVRAPQPDHTAGLLPRLPGRRRGVPVRHRQRPGDRRPRGVPAGRLVLAHGLARLGQLVPGGSRRSGLLLVALVAAAPMGVVWSMTYSEGCSAPARCGRWSGCCAGTGCSPAGAPRWPARPPTAAALLLAVGVALLFAAVRRHDGWRPWLAGCSPRSACSATCCTWRPGPVPSWLVLPAAAGWNSKFDAGAATLAFTRDTLATGAPCSRWSRWPCWPRPGAARRVLAAEPARRAAVAASGVRGRVLAMDLGSNGLMNSKAGCCCRRSPCSCPWRWR